jgi:hypothetical protein
MKNVLFSTAFRRKRQSLDFFLSDFAYFTRSVMRDHTKGQTVKERLKKFYEDHEPLVLGVVIGAASFGATLLVINKIIDGKDIRTVQRMMYDDGAMDVRVILKNGSMQHFGWKADAG